MTITKDSPKIVKDEFGNVFQLKEKNTLIGIYTGTKYISYWEKTWVYEPVSSLEVI